MQQRFFEGQELPEPMSEQQTRDCFIKMAAGDLTARSEIIMHNLRLVRYIVYSKCNFSYNDKEDLTEIGIIGLIKAVDSFKLDYNNKFNTYATHCIENEILMFLRKERNWEKVDYLDKPLIYDDSGRELSLKDILPDQDCNLEEDYVEQRTVQIILNIINQLQPRDRYIVESYFGFIDDEPLTQRKIAQILGISYSRVSRLLIRTLKNIRRQLQEQGIMESTYHDQKKSKH